VKSCIPLYNMLLMCCLSACQHTSAQEDPPDAVDMSQADAPPDLTPQQPPDSSKDQPDLHDPQDLQELDARPDYQPGAKPLGHPKLHIAHGKDRLTLLSQGDVVRWEAGPQGGYHIWTGVAIDDELIASLTDEQRRSVSHRYQLWRADGTLLASASRQGGLRRDEAAPGAWHAIGQYAVLEAPVRPRRLDAELLRYRVEVTIPLGLTLWSSTYITSQCCD
jgi:hypothetical protein